MKHYVVLCNSAASHIELDETHVTAVTHCKEKAKRILQEKSQDERVYARSQSWDILVDSDEEFNAGESGSYAAEHIRFYIEEVEE